MTCIAPSFTTMHFLEQWVFDNKCRKCFENREHLHEIKTLIHVNKLCKNKYVVKLYAIHSQHTVH